MAKEFSEKVYAILKSIPKGKVTTYKRIAMILNSSPRAVGQALKRNPNAPMVPCHRVVHEDGRTGGYSGVQDSKKKVMILRKEGVRIKDGIVDRSDII